MDNRLHGSPIERLAQQMHSRIGPVSRSNLRAREIDCSPLTQLSHMILSGKRSNALMAAQPLDDSGYDSPHPTYPLNQQAASWQKFGSPTKERLSHLATTPALVKAWAADEDLPEPNVVDRNPRRSSGAMRQDMKQRGSFFLKVVLVDNPSALDPFKGFGSEAIAPASYQTVDPRTDKASHFCMYQPVTPVIVVISVSRLYRQITNLERPAELQDAKADLKFLQKIFNKGVLVSKGGCIYPHPQYCTRG